VEVHRPARFSLSRHHNGTQRGSSGDSCGPGAVPEDRGVTPTHFTFGLDECGGCGILKDRGSHLHISHSYAAVLMGTRIGALVARVMSISRLGKSGGGNGTME